MELTFASKQIREVAINKDIAYKQLGDDLAKLFLSLIADMREAMFIGELPERPSMSRGLNAQVLSFHLLQDAFLETEALVDQSRSDKKWEDAHRIKLIRIYKNGEILV